MKTYVFVLGGFACLLNLEDDSSNTSSQLLSRLFCNPPPKHLLLLVGKVLIAS